MAIKNTGKKIKKVESKTNTQLERSAREIELEEKLSKMMDTMEALQAKYDALASQQAAPTVSITSPSTDVTLVYMSESLGVIQATNLTLNCTRFGEEFVLSRTQFDEIVGKYRHWFDNGILAVSYRNTDVAAAKGLKTDKEYALSADVLRKIGSMTTDQLEELWNSTPTKEQKVSIATYFKRKFIENIDSGFRDRAKVDLLNRLTDGGFSRESAELSGNFKILPTDMN